VCIYTHTHTNKTHTHTHTLTHTHTHTQDLNGTSDPYCVLAVGKHTPVLSQVHYQTCNPVFKEIFEFADPARTDTLSVSVFDKDVLSDDDLIGMVRVPLADIVGNTPRPPEWYPVLLCMYICMYVCMYVWMDGWMYVCGTCMYVCIYVCMYTSIHIVGSTPRPPK